MSHLFQLILTQPMFNGFVALYNLIPDVGVVILVITILIKLILYPLTKSSIKSQKALTDLQPKLNELKEKYKDDKQRVAQETMRLYKENKVNPFASCLPLLIQLPILIALYYVLQIALKGDQFGLLYSFMNNPGSINRISLGLFDLEKASEVAREQELVKMLKAPGKRTIIGSETIDGVFVLRKGRKVDAESIKEWGIDHIKYKHIEHDEKFKNAFGKTLDDEDIKKIAEKVIDGGTPVKSTHEGIKEAVEKTITYEGKEAKVRVVYFIKKFEGAIPGDIATVFIP